MQGEEILAMGDTKSHAQSDPTHVRKEHVSVTKFFEIVASGRSFACVIDCSESMATRNLLEVAKQELSISLNLLSDDARFSVIFYNMRTKVISGTDGQLGMMLATAANKAKVQSQFKAVTASGRKDHMLALRTALALKPDVVFVLTNADLMTSNDVSKILGLAGRSQVQAVEFGLGSALASVTPFRRLATSTHGTWHYIDLTTLHNTASKN